MANSSARTIQLAPLAGSGANGTSPIVLDACVAVQGLWAIGPPATASSADLRVGAATYGAFLGSDALALGLGGVDSAGLGTLFVPAVVSVEVRRMGGPHVWLTGTEIIHGNWN